MLKLDFALARSLSVTTRACFAFANLTSACRTSFLATIPTSKKAFET